VVLAEIRKIHQVLQLRVVRHYQHQPVPNRQLMDVLQQVVVQVVLEMVRLPLLAELTDQRLMAQQVLLELLSLHLSAQRMVAAAAVEIAILIQIRNFQDAQVVLVEVVVVVRATQ
jgi:hypothetical protein